MISSSCHTIVAYKTLPKLMHHMRANRRSRVLFCYSGPISPLSSAFLSVSHHAVMYSFCETLIFTDTCNLCGEHYKNLWFFFSVLFVPLFSAPLPILIFTRKSSATERTGKVIPLTHREFLLLSHFSLLHRLGGLEWMNDSVFAFSCFFLVFFLIFSELIPRKIWKNRELSVFVEFDPHRTAQAVCLL